VDGDGTGELILGDNRILTPGDLTENVTIGDLILCDLDSTSPSLAYTDNQMYRYQL
jgi:hypothetical protein